VPEFDLSDDVARAAAFFAEWGFVVVRAIDGASMSNLADSLQWCGELDDAERLHRAVLATRRAVFGEGHHDTLASAMLLAGTLTAQKRSTEAESVIRTVIAMQDAGEEMHPDKAASHSLLAIVLCHQRRHTDAEECMRRVVRACEAAYGESDAHARESRELMRHIAAVAARAKCVMCERPASSACARCARSLYCSRECQRSDWRAHRRVCRASGCASA
jgi:hypothetical protein